MYYDKMADIRNKLFVVVITFAFVKCNTQQNERVSMDAVVPTQSFPWPAPQKMVSSDVQIAVNADFRFVFSSNQRCDILETAFVRYQELTFGREWSTLRFRRPTGHISRSNVLVDSLQVHVQSPCEEGAYPTLDSDESYSLSVETSSSAVLRANQVWGALRGLETFSQLVYRSDQGMFLVNKTEITDYPRFRHRGLLIDTSRHFLSTKILKENLDIMSQNKFNVFHWHIVDDPSFPYESFTFPQMSEKGAYQPFTHVYSQQDVKDIIEYARVRGIRVIPEFDSPGHTQSWGKGIPDLLTKCYSKGVLSGTYGPINPVPSSTYTFLNQFFTELAAVFPDHYVHLGGDEVSFNCWKSNPDIVKFMNASGFGEDYSKLEQHYMQKLLDIVNGVKKGYIIWQEVIDNGAKVAADTVIEVWKGGYKQEMSRVTSLGYKVILSSPWYINRIAYGSDWSRFYSAEPLDFHDVVCCSDIKTRHYEVAQDTVVQVWKGGYQNELGNVTKMGYHALLSSCWYLDYIQVGPQWKTYYTCDPQNFDGSQSQKDLVLGGEACMWGEYVDGTNLISRTWPRASAVAERLWSAADVNNVNTATPRIEEHRCRLLRRGYAAEPQNGPGFCREEFKGR